MKLADLFEAGKMKETTAESDFARYQSLKKSNADPAMLAKVLAMATAKMDEKFKNKKRDYESKYAGSDWWEEVKKMYKIEEQGNKFVVISNARDWKQTKDWEFDTKYQAIEQIEKLIGYKHNDRKAGHGSHDKDFERVEKLTSKS